MFRYIVKRILLFIPTIFIVSVLTFLLSKQVPGDQVQILLNLQGLNDYDESWNKEYHALAQKMNVHLPVFYFTIQPNYQISLSSDTYSLYEQKFIHAFLEKKYSKDYLTELINALNKLPEKYKRQALSSLDIKQLQRKIVGFGKEVPFDTKDAISSILKRHASGKVKWHYPVIHYHGIQNQYHKWMSNIMYGDFGVSLIDTRPVTSKINEALKWSFLLVVLSLFFALLFSFPLGVITGMRPNSPTDTIVNSTLFAFYAVPKFWLATLMIIFFTTSEYGTWTNIFPSVGIWYSSGVEGFWQMLSASWHKLILPVLIIVVQDVAYLTRMIRAGVQEERQKEYIKTAKSKGLTNRDITYKHILPNALIPTVALIVGALPGALASGLIIEVIFNIPGVGRLMYESIVNADWPMVYPIVLIISVLSVLIFLLGDLLMAFLNPKIKFE